MANNKIISELLKYSETLSNIFPSLLSHRNTLSNNILGGEHPTRKSGYSGEFLQYKEYRQGDVLSTIDWRRSASSKKIFVREKEKNISKKVYIHVDSSKSMLFKSEKVNKNKQFVSYLLALTLCRLFIKDREQVYLFNNKSIPIKCSNNIHNFGESFLETSKENTLPNYKYFQGNSTTIIISDFFYETEELFKLLHKLKNRNIDGYLIQILDPFEVKLNINKSINLVDSETNEKIIINSNRDFLNLYEKKLELLKNRLISISKSVSWNFITQQSDTNLKRVLFHIVKQIIANKTKAISNV